MLIYGFIYWLQLRTKIQTYVKVKGIVISNEKNAYFDSDTPWSSIIEYEAAGKAYTLTSSGQHSRPVKTGTKITLIYDPEFPSNAYIHEEYYAAPLVLAMLGIMFIFLGSAF